MSARPSVSTDVTTFITSPCADRSYRVVIRSGAKAGEWGTYASIEAAAAVAAKLRRHGMDATVVEVVEGRE